MEAPFPGPLAYSDHLVTLIGRAEAAAARVATADSAARLALVPAARRRAARLSARLDASPLTDETADRVDAREAGGLPLVDALVRFESAPASERGGWASALKLEGLPTQEVAAVEYANLLAGFDAEPALAAELFEQPLSTLTRLHGLLVGGLVAPDVIGRPRQSSRAIHDGAQGRVVYHPPDPRALPALLEAFAGWLGSGSAAKPTLVVAGVVHERLLQWQPFEAANGRLARAAARLVLRARGLDPDGVAVIDEPFAAEPLAYHAEVAATIRRRGNLVPWLQRWCAAAAGAFEAVADTLSPIPVPPPSERALAGVGEMAAHAPLSLRDYLHTTGVSAETARGDLQALERAGLIRAEQGTQGLRWRRC